MAKKLNLKLNYKGKPLDFVRHDKDFVKQFFIGSNKWLYWQILDPSFPDKHLFIQQKGDQLVMNLLPGAQLSCTKDGNAVDSNFLKQNNILNGNQLVLKPDMNGTVALNPDWEISYEFKEPWVVVLTQEEKQIVAQYARRTEPTAVERFNRNMIFLFIFLALVFVILFDLVLKSDTTFDQTIEERLQTLQSIQASKIVPDLEETNAAFVDQGSTTAEAPKDDTPAPETQQTAQTGRPGSGGVSGGSAGLSSLLGNFDPNATSTGAQIQIVTTAESFVAARPGSRPGSGPGSGPGAGTAGTGSASSTFSAAVGPSFSGDIGAVATSGPKFAGYATRPEGAQGVNVVGDASKIAPSGRVFGETAQMKQVAADFSRRNIATIAEADIAALTDAQRSDYANLRDQVVAKQSQIEAAYRAAGAPATYSFDITLRIEGSGRVVSAEVVPKGSIPEDFVAEVKRIVESWSFRVKEALAYKFPMRLRK